MDLGTLRTYRTPLPKEARQSFHRHWSMRKNGSCSMYLSSRKTQCRTAKERMVEGAGGWGQVSSVRFTNTDSFAYAQFWMKNPGSYKTAEVEMHRASLQSFAEKVQKHPGHLPIKTTSVNNKQEILQLHLKHLNEHYAHQVSKEIMDFKEKSDRDTGTAGVWWRFSRISMYYRSVTIRLFTWASASGIIWNTSFRSQESY